MKYIGINIGGTKCSITFAEKLTNRLEIFMQGKNHTTKDYMVWELLENIANEIIENCSKHSLALTDFAGIGISCGGPLDAEKGIILSPPNLIGWDNINIKKFFEDKLSLKVWLCNDANACALAEWQYGAGKGSKNIIFLTFGTGLGAGFILDNKLYSGTNDMAGEVGHIRLHRYGPVGYGKSGSFEGFCSGGGIVGLAKLLVLEELQKGNKPNLCKNFENLASLTAKDVGEKAKEGDALALKILEIVGENLGMGLSFLIDILNPEKIIIGSIFEHCYDEIWPYAEKIIELETLAKAREVCKVVSGELGETIGDYAALAVADYNNLRSEN